jgi:undecaprenyl-diphosphatase
MPFLYVHDAFVKVQAALVSPWLDLPMAILTTACEGWSLALIGLSVVWVMERRLVQTFRSAFPMLMGLITAGLVVQVVKRLVHTPRPLTVLGAQHVHLVLEPLGQLSFPSGHAAAVAALAMAVTLRYGRLVTWVWVLAFLGGLSRVYVGAHWVTDVAAGWLIGALCALAVTNLLRALLPRFPRSPASPQAVRGRTAPEAV